MTTYILGVALGLLLCLLTILLKIDNTFTSIASGMLGMIIALVLESIGWLKWLLEEFDLLKTMFKEEDIIETNRKLTVESEELSILDSETVL